ncbi:hypothetical protein QQS21_001282 [Conoideocrella luteorostrata]|uniref:Transcriptional regulator n=1 Tax=Conoideocrella luteorostrata TaxID=1105319 RepID=A0AAJ0D002_9HYPO|nr:hypothetical protein QQS21_001282 [Conoideocrella luteorostrata]
MYFSAAHQETDLHVLQQLIRDHPLGSIITGIPSAKYPFLQLSHIPFVLDIEDACSKVKKGRLRGHLTRQNPQSQAILEALALQPTKDNVLIQEVLIVFQSPDHYVTPKFYTDTKPSTGKVVPTWNYAAVQAYGPAKIFFDSGCPETCKFLDKQLADLSHQSETRIMGYTGGAAPAEWKPTDAPERYIEILKKSIIGIEITINRLEGKFKMSQDKNPNDRQGVIQGFASLRTEGAAAVGEMIRERSELKDKH